MKQYYALINKLTTKPGNRDKVIQYLLESGEAFPENSSCINYLVFEDAINPNVIWVVDVWKNKADHTAALAQPDLKPYIEKTMPLLEGMPEQHEIHLRGGKGL